MFSFTVRQNKRYRAQVRLSFLEAIASNDRIAEELRKHGFVDVTVLGSGRDRIAEGRWPSPDVTAEMPDRISSIEETG